MKRYLLLLTIILALAEGIQAQEPDQQEFRTVEFYIGVQPGLVPIPFDEFGRYAFDVNIIPLTVEYALNVHWGFRLHSIWDVQFRPEFPTVFSRAGAEITIPYYLPARTNEIGHRGLYAGPLVSGLYSGLNDYYELRAGAEGGYSLLFGNQWSLSISAQVGVKFQFEPGNPFIRMFPFTMPRIAFGIWI